MVSNRDEFSEKTKNQIAETCGLALLGPVMPRAHSRRDSRRQGEINIGIAAHICAAAPGGPRYDEEMPTGDRGAADNGIWLCQEHPKAIDSDPKQHHALSLRDWKKQAEEAPCGRVLRGEGASALAAAAEPIFGTRLRERRRKISPLSARPPNGRPLSVALRL